jgi:dynein intermediate chain 3, axonemal
VERKSFCKSFFFFYSLNFRLTKITFFILKSGALLQTKSFKDRVSDAEWSPTRPGVFFIAKANGMIDIWDLLDRTHAPILTQTIGVQRLTFLSFKVVSRK